MKHLMPALIAMLFVPLSCGGGGGGEQALTIEKQALVIDVKKNVETLLEGVDSAIQFLDDSDKFQEFAGFTQDSEEICEPPSPDNPEGEPICYEEDPEPIDLDLTDLIVEVVDFIEDGVMSDSQLEEETPTKLVYLLDPESFCSFEGEAGGDGEGREYEDLEEDDDDCMEFLSSVPVRISFTSPSEDNVNAEILLGEDRLKLARIQIHDGLLSIEVDLDDARKVLELINQERGDGEDEFIPDVMTGKIRLSLELLDPGVYRLQFEVVEALDVQVSTDEGDISVQLGKSKQYLLVDASAAGNETLNLVSETGSLDIALPYQFLMNSLYDEEEEGEGSMDGEGEFEEDPVEVPTVSGTASIHLAGFTGNLGLSDTDQIDLSNFGLGDSQSWVNIGNDTVLAVNLNPDDGRSLQIVYGMDSDWVYFKPALDLQLDWNMAPVASDFEDLPDFLLNESFRVLFNQGAPNKIVFPEVGEDETEVLKIDDGVLSLTSSAAPDETVTVSAGQCFWFAEDDDEMEEGEDQEPEGHALLSAIEVGDCP